MIVARAQAQVTEPGLQAFSGAFSYAVTVPMTLVWDFTLSLASDVVTISTNPFSSAP